MTTAEYEAHFSLWCLLAAPLMAGNDLRSMTPDIARILTNTEVLLVDQDGLGRQGRKVRDDGDLEVWAKEMADGSRAVILLNRSAAEAKITASWTDIGYPAGLPAKVRDLWKHKDMGIFKTTYAAAVPAHGVAMIRVTP